MKDRVKERGEEDEEVTDVVRFGDLHCICKAVEGRSKFALVVTEIYTSKFEVDSTKDWN